MQMPVPMTAWNWKERLPDMLWISAIMEAYPGKWQLFDDALEPLEALMATDPTVLDGRLTTFEAMPAGSRYEARARLRAVAPDVLLADLGHALALLHQAPGAWMFDGGMSGDGDERELGVAFLRRHIAKLNDSRGEWACHARMAALKSHIRHGRLAVSADVESFKLLGRYPTGLTEDERETARRSARMMFDLLLSTQEEADAPSRAWAELFWRQTPKLAVDS